MHGIVIADLSETRTLDDFVDRVARALGFDAIDSTHGAATALDGAGAIVLGLDGVDGAFDVARPVLGDWLDRAPALTLIVTSRAQLRLSGEHVIEIPPLAVPRGDELDGDAARVFLRAVKRLRSDYAPAAS